MSKIVITSEFTLPLAYKINKDITHEFFGYIFEKSISLASGFYNSVFENTQLLTCDITFSKE